MHKNSVAVGTEQEKNVTRNISSHFRNLNQPKKKKCRTCLSCHEQISRDHSFVQQNLERKDNKHKHKGSQA